MENKSLYSILLGGKIEETNLMEDHKLVFVIASSEEDARIKAKAKWKINTVHVDGTMKIESVDGYDILLKKNNSVSDKFEVNPKYSL